uniref:Uncharacterized protein n=1 Tax=Arundo donax TaxID=35708 RepID=A0A0A9A2B7_ARUDO
MLLRQIRMEVKSTHF